jgi:heptosyltransferase I
VTAESPAPQSICILRLSAIGDVCHAVSVVQAIGRHFPQARLTWIIGKVEASLLQGLPDVELVIFDKRRGWRAFLDLRKALAGRRFDVLLHMQVALRANLASLMIRAKRKIGFDWRRAKELHALFMRERIAPASPGQTHVLDGFAGFARHLGVPLDPGQPSVWAMPMGTAETQWARAQLRPFQERDTQRFLAICPAASKAERNWLPERYAAIADHATARGLQVILCGGPTALERELRDAIVRHCQCQVLDLVGQTSLKQLLALLQAVTLVLAPDSGPAHMAVTVGTPVIGLYGHSNPQRTGPYLYRHYVVEAYHEALLAQTGKTAAQLPFGTRVKGAQVMQGISVAAVQQMLDRVLAELPP